MTCDNLFQHINALQPVGDALCEAEAASQTWLAAAGFEPYHIVFNALLLTVIILVLIKTTFKGHDISIGTIGSIAGIIAGLIILGIL